MSEPLQVETDFTFSQGDFERVRALIYRHAGISLNPNKQTMVYSRLSRRLRGLGLNDFKTYLDRLEADARQPEWQEFVNALTTNLTSFYRESHHFPILTDLARKAAGHGGSFNVWCCAASTGEEPFTIAITLAEALRGTSTTTSVLATDIDTNVLARADRGVYPAESVAKIDPALVKRYFMRGTGPNEGHVRVKPELRQMIQFRQLNLLDGSWPMKTSFDAIFCRNVMIYFDKDTQYRVLRNLAGFLKPEGRLFAGHSENFTQARDVFELEGRTVYRRAAASAQRAAA